MPKPTAAEQGLSLAVDTRGTSDLDAASIRSAPGTMSATDRKGHDEPPPDPARPGSRTTPTPVDRQANPFLGGQPVGAAATGEHHSPASTWMAVGLSIALNLTSLIGVITFGWPPGNVLALFWIENVIIGLWSALKVATARGGEKAIPTAFFFCFHYGIFCLVHGVFTAIVVFQIGFQPSFWWLGFPAILIMIRYGAETATTWFGAASQRDRLSPKEAMAIPYPRIIVLHLSILISFGMLMGSGQVHDVAVKIQDVLRPILSLLPSAAQSQGVGMILILIVIKAAVDIVTTRRAVTK